MTASESFDLTAGEPETTSTATPVRVRGLSELRASIPYLLGFYPERSLVVLGLQRDGSVLVTVRADAPKTADDAVTVVSQLAPVLRRCDPYKVLVAYCDDYELTTADEHAREQITSSAVRLYETVRELAPVLERELGSFGLATEFVWPENPGMPRTDAGPVPQIAVANAVAGRRLLRNRAEVRAQLEPVRGGVRRQVRDQITALESVPLDRMDLLALVTDILESYAVAAESGSGSAPTQARHLAICALALRDVMLRDLLIIVVAQERAWWQPDLWCSAVRLVPTADVAAVATMAAITAYLTGDGALAQSACDRALQHDPAYSLAGMVSDSLRLGIRPQELQEMLASMLDQEGAPERL